VCYRPNLIIRKSPFTRSMNGRTNVWWTLVTLPNSWLLTTGVANGIINAKNNEHLESRIETFPTGESPDRRSLKRNLRFMTYGTSVTVPGDVFKSTWRAILSMETDWDLATKHVSRLSPTYLRVSTSVTYERYKSCMKFGVPRENGCYRRCREAASLRRWVPS